MFKLYDKTGIVRVGGAKNQAYTCDQQMDRTMHRPTKTRSEFSFELRSVHLSERVNQTYGLSFEEIMLCLRSYRYEI